MSCSPSGDGESVMSWEGQTCPICDVTGWTVRSRHGTAGSGGAHAFAWLMWHIREDHNISIGHCMLCGENMPGLVWSHEWRLLVDHYELEHPEEYGKPFEKAVTLAYLGVH